MNRVFLIAFIAFTLAVTSTVGKPRCTWDVACENPKHMPGTQCCYFKRSRMVGKPRCTWDVACENPKHMPGTQCCYFKRSRTVGKPRCTWDVACENPKHLPGTQCCYFKRSRAVGKPRCTWDVACENPKHMPGTQCCYFKRGPRPDPMERACRGSEEWEGVCKDQLMTGCHTPYDMMTIDYFCWRQCYPGSTDRCLAATKDGRVMTCKKGDHEDCANRGATSRPCRESYMCKRETRPSSGEGEREAKTGFGILQRRVSLP